MVSGANTAVRTADATSTQRIWPALALPAIRPRTAVTADQLELTRAADAVRVYRGGNHLLYANHLTPVGQWDRPATSRQAIVAERERPWTASQTGATSLPVEHASGQWP